MLAVVSASCAGVAVVRARGVAAVRRRNGALPSDVPRSSSSLRRTRITMAETNASSGRGAKVSLRSRRRFAVRRTALLPPRSLVRSNPSSQIDEALAPHASATD